MNLFKKNQIIIYVIALMLVTAGYLNYTSKGDNSVVATSTEVEEMNSTELADIGDATLVNSDDVIDEEESKNVSNNTNDINTSTQNSTTNNILENNTITTSSDVNNNDYFTKSKLERDTMYSQMIETYEKVLNSTNSLETQRQTATQEITKINETKNSIMVCENLIKTKGFENSVIFVNGESISIIIGAQELEQDEIAQIQNIISRELKAEIQNIHIATK